MREDTDMPSVDTSPVDIVDTHGRTSEDFDTDCGDSDFDANAARESMLRTTVDRVPIHCHVCGWVRATENCGCVRAGYRASLPGDHPANVVSRARRDR